MKTSLLPRDDAPTTDDSLVGYDRGTTHGSTKRTLISKLITLFFSNVPQGVIDDTKLDAPRWWHEIGRAQLTAASSSIAVTDLPPRKYLKILVHTIASGLNQAVLRLNNSASNVYSVQVSDDFAAPADVVSISRMALDGGIANANHEFIQIDIINVSGIHKLIFANSVWGAGAPTAAPDSRQGNGKWSVTDVINEVDLVEIDTGTFGIGSEVVVLGHD